MPLSGTRGPQPELERETAQRKGTVHCHAGCPQDDVLDALAAQGLDIRRSKEVSPINDYRYPTLGKPSHTWPYHDAGGGVVAYSARFETKSGKTFRPLTFKDGHWWAQGLPAPRPLFNLPAILSRPNAPILVCEGEKAAEAAARLFPDVVATTPMHGAKSPHKSDWTPLKGRDATVWPDNDEAGVTFANTVAELVRGVGANSVSIVQLPDNLPESWDLADDPPAGLDLEKLLAGAPEHESSEDANSDDDEFTRAVTHLAALQPHEYDHQRKEEAERLGVRAMTLDDAVKAARAAMTGSDGLQGRAIEWAETEPWPEPVDGAALLDDLATLITHFITLPDGGAEAVALWALYAWGYDAFSVAPNLMVTAPERDCGKTRVTDLLSWMVPRPKPLSDASVAAIKRGIEKDHPTLLIDEAQSFLKRRHDDPIRGILLASFSRRFAFVETCEGEANEVRRFSTFTPKAMNGRNLANVDDMLTSRSIVIPMTRASRPMPELRDDRDPVGEDRRRHCARWRDDHRAPLREADPDMGGRINRAAQVWRPLFAIADAAGGAWPGRARKAADDLAASTKAITDNNTLGMMMLADTQAVFRDAGDPDRMTGKELDAALIALPERPWAAIGRSGKPLTAQKRGQLLKPYGITTQTIRTENDTAKGYWRSSFKAAWDAYLPVSPVTNEEFEERAAIMEYVGGLSREEAERAARAPQTGFSPGGESDAGWGGRARMNTSQAIAVIEETGGWVKPDGEHIRWRIPKPAPGQVAEAVDVLKRRKREAMIKLLMHESERKFNLPSARLYPLIGYSVVTPEGQGVLHQVFSDQVRVLLEGESKTRVFPPDQIAVVADVKSLDARFA